MTEQERKDRKNAQARLRYAENPELRALLRAKHIEYYQGHSEDWKRRCKSWPSIPEKYQKEKERHPEKVKSRYRFKWAVKSRKIERQPCEKCGAFGEGHHEDYGNPFSVRWLCRKHHMELHRIPDCVI